MAPAFNLTPASAKTGVLQYADKDERMLYEKACSKLSDDEFDCQEDQVMDFMNSLKQRAREYGWDERIMMIPSDPEDMTSEMISILDAHGSLSMEAILAYEKSYMDKKNRPRQDMQCLYKAIMSSLSRVGRVKVSLEREKYILKNSRDEDVYSGNLLLKVVLTKSSIDNKSGAFSIRMELADLPRLMESVKYDVSKFNERVKYLMEQLNTRGETSADLPFNLFQAFKTVPVTQFQTFIDRLKDDWDEDMEDGITEVSIMDRCENKYKNLTKEKVWSIKDSEDDRILALQAKIKKLEKLSRATGKGKRRETRTSGKTGKTGKSGKGGAVDIDKKPRDISKPVTIGGKKWWWCSKETGGKCEGKLRRHNPKDCKGFAFLKNKSNPSKRQKMGEYIHEADKLIAQEHAFYGTDDGESEDTMKGASSTESE